MNKSGKNIAVAGIFWGFFGRFVVILNNKGA